MYHRYHRYHRYLGYLAVRELESYMCCIVHVHVSSFQTLTYRKAARQSLLCSTSLSKKRGGAQQKYAGTLPLFLFLKFLFLFPISQNSILKREPGCFQALCGLNAFIHLWNLPLLRRDSYLTFVFPWPPFFVLLDNPPPPLFVSPG